MSLTSIVFSSLLLVISLNNVYSDVFFSDVALPTFQLNKCSSICNESYKATDDDIFFALSTDADSCARGCRFFTIAQMLSDMDADIAAEACQGCCDDSYLDSKRKSCNYGCNTMTKFVAELGKPPVVKSLFSIDILFDNGDSSDEQGQQSAGDLEMDDVLMDPALRNQLSINILDDSKLPEMKIKTLPIGSDKFEEIISVDETPSSLSQSSSDCLWWLRSVFMIDHLPPCILISVLVVLLILLLRLVFTCDIRSNVLTHSPFSKDDMSSLTKSELSESKTVPVTVILESEKNRFDIVAPNVHKMPPPKYDEAMINGANILEGDLSHKATSSTTPIV